MKVKFNLWLEKEGEVVLSRWRIQLLESLHESGSITAAAANMQVPYRKAWERIHEMEDRLGEPLVITEVGGAGGGGAELTAYGLEIISRFHQMTEGLGEDIQSRFLKAFDGIVDVEQQN